jgi:hypothetical protein
MEEVEAVTNGWAGAGLFVLLLVLLLILVATWVRMR